jgi:hypothetical protein
MSRRVSQEILKKKPTGERDMTVTREVAVFNRVTS